MGRRSRSRSREKRRDRSRSRERRKEKRSRSRERRKEKRSRSRDRSRDREKEKKDKEKRKDKDKDKDRDRRDKDDGKGKDDDRDSEKKERKEKDKDRRKEKRKRSSSSSGSSDLESASKRKRTKTADASAAKAPSGAASASKGGEGGSADASAGGGPPGLSADMMAKLKAAQELAAASQATALLVKKEHEVAEKIQKERQQAYNSRVYVGSISFDLTEKEIHDLFKQHGEIKSITFLKDPVTLQHKGFAFVEYTTPEAVSAAMRDLQGHSVGGRNLKLGRANTTAGVPSALGGSGVPLVNARIYVGSVAYELNEDDLKNIFEPFGTVRAVQLMPSHEQGRSHAGYGFLEFTTEKAAEDAITQMNGFELGGRQLKIGRATGTTGTTGGTIYEVNVPVFNLPKPSTGSTVPQIGAGGQIVATTESITQLLAAHAHSDTTEEGKVAREQAEQMELQMMANAMGGTFSGVLPMPEKKPAAAAKTPAAAAASAGSGADGARRADDDDSSEDEYRGPDQEALDEEAREERRKKKENQKAAFLKPVEDTLESEEHMAISGNQRFALIKRLTRDTGEEFTNSRCVALYNMVDPEEVDELLEDEIREECQKYGDVLRVVIFQNMLAATPEVKIYVLFDNPQGAATARQALDKRWFAGRTVDAEFFSEDDLHKMSSS